jgi:transketolase
MPTNVPATYDATLLRAKAHSIRQCVLRLAASRFGAHVGGSLSCVEILVALYGYVMKYDPEDMQAPGRDRLIMSKGHASAALYAALAEFGILDLELVHRYGEPDCPLWAHPDRETPGVEFSTGSLGHGLPVGVGVAYGLARRQPRARVYVLLGDGELQEGTNWEAAMLASQLGLSNLTGIVDRNTWQIGGKTESCVSLEPLAERWRAFGWSATECDGHDLSSLSGALLRTGEQPRVIIAATRKGRGLPHIEDTQQSHFAKLSPSGLARALRDLESRS